MNSYKVLVSKEVADELVRMGAPLLHAWGVHENCYSHEMVDVQGNKVVSFHGVNYIIPTISEVCAWLREKKRVSVCVDYCVALGLYEYRCYDLNTNKFLSSKFYAKHENAECSGVNYAINYINKAL